MNYALWAQWNLVVFQCEPSWLQSIFIYIYGSSVMGRI